NPFDEGDRSGVALALTKSDNAGVTAVTTGRAWRDVIEQFFDGILLPQHRESRPSRVKRAIFSEGYHFFGERTNGLGLGQCGFDTFVLDQAANLIGEQRFAMLSGASELDRLLLVPHAPARMLVDPLRALLRGCAIWAGAVDPGGRHIHQTGIELHAQTQAELLKFLFDF